MADKKKIPQDLHSRRSFFKLAGKKILPLFATLTVVSQFLSLPVKAVQQIGCGWSCLYSCMGGCSRSCMYSCTGGCSNTCQWSCVNTCAVACGNGCKGGCTDTCAWGCSSCVAECRIGCGSGCSGTCIAQCSSYSEHATYN